MNLLDSNRRRFELVPWEDSLCMLDIPGRRMLDALKTGSELVSPGRPERYS